MSGGPAIAGGFNLASYFGELDSVDTLTHVMFGELTHTQPNPFINDTVSWNFLYTAPDSILTDTIYSVGNSVNWDSIPSNFDQWNFGQNFAVQVTDYPVNLSNENNSPKDFVLYQNYPNPFNPSTRISFQISDFGFVSLKVYDILGNEIAVLVNGNLAAGEYEVEFNINSVENRDLTSGIYFYQLTQEGPESNPTDSDAGLEQGFAETKKMILLK
ncbi:MAG: T9SS type A sorting domain-containing protein [Ignavibacteriaceae bacterium]|nr:T9SS type A sorting domain-containing protein [Ignavibacteriaceae bacterium]